MADVTVPPQPGGLFGIGMDDTILLDIGTVANFNVPKVTPQSSPWADVTIFPDRHTTDEDSSWMYKRSFSDLGPFPFEFVDGHGVQFLSERF
jgi:hypothetical protein